MTSIKNSTCTFDIRICHQADITQVAMVTDDLIKVTVSLLSRSMEFQLSRLPARNSYAELLVMVGPL